MSYNSSQTEQLQNSIIDQDRSSQKRDINYFGSIHYEFGQFHNVSDYNASQIDKNILLEQGYSNYSVISENTIEDLVASSCKNSLNSCNLIADNIDTIIVASNSPKHVSSIDSSIHLALKNIGCTHQVVIGLKYSLCASFSSALRIANALLDNVSNRNILILCVDVFQDEFHRIGPKNLHMMSDCISSCVVSSTPNEYKILSIAQCGRYDVLGESATGPEINPLEKLQKLVTSLEALKHNLNRQTNIDIRKIDHVVVENLNFNAMHFILNSLMIDDEKIHFRGKKDHGHAATSDLLISLDLTTKEVECSNNAPIVLLTISSTTISIMLVEYCGVRK